MSHVLNKPALWHNKSVDQPAYARSLISVFDVRYLDSTITKISV